MKKINREAYDILKKLYNNQNRKWIARDKDGCLYAFTEKPVKTYDPSSYGWDTEGWSAEPYSTLEIINKVHLFPFIQWEDEEPHNIARLLGEYEEAEYGYFNNELYKVIAVQDSQNLIVPKQEEITEEQVMEWLDNNDFYDHATAETVLANAVDKGELGYYGTKYSVVKKPVIPQFVADWISVQRDIGYTLQQTFYQVHWAYKDNDMNKEEDWVASNGELFARAWIDGFTVRKEKKYVVKTNLGTYLIIDTSKREWDYTSIPPQDDDIQYAYKFDDRSMAEETAKLIEGKVEVWEE